MQFIDLREDLLAEWSVTGLESQMGCCNTNPNSNYLIFQDRAGAELYIDRLADVLESSLSLGGTR